MLGRNATEIFIRPDGSVFFNMPPPGLVGRGSGRSRHRVPAQTPAPPAFLRFAPRRREIRRFHESCALCPLECGWNRLRRPHPRCGGSRPTLACVGISAAEEPSLCGGSGSGIILLGACPLACPACIDREKMETAPFCTLPALFNEAWRLRNDGAATLQIVNATAHAPMVGVLLSALKESGFDLPVAVKSSGFEKKEIVRALGPFVDVWVPDLKFGPRSAAAGVSGAPGYFETVKDAIAIMRSLAGPAKFLRSGVLKRGVIARHVDTGLPRSERRSVDRFLASLPRGVIVSRKPFLPLPAPPPGQAPA